MTDEYQIDNVTWAEKDSDGDIVVDPDVVNPDKLHSTHYISPSDDAQATIDAGGADSTFVFLSGEHTATIGADEDWISVPYSNVGLIISTGATIKLGDGELSSGDVGRIIRLGDGSNDYENIRVVGQGAIDGNNMNNTVNSPEQGAAVKIERGVNNVEISVDIFNSTGEGIYSQGSASTNNSRHQYHSCRFIGCDEPIRANHTNQLLIVNNTIDTTDTQDGIEVDAGTGWILANNTVKNTAGSAFDVTQGASYGLISNNHITECGVSSIDIASAGTSSSDVYVTNNLIENIDSGPSGINVQSGAVRTWIGNNWLMDSDGIGISVGTATDTYIIDNQIRNFTQRNNIHGIIADGSDGLWVQGNVIEDNYQHGIQMKNNPTDAYVLGNYFRDNGSLAIDAGDAAATIRRNVFETGGLANVGSATMQFNVGYNDPTETLDGMTADPENGSEDGYLTITIAGADYQIPFYNA